MKDVFKKNYKLSVLLNFLSMFTQINNRNFKVKIRTASEKMNDVCSVLETPCQPHGNTKFKL